MIIIDSGEKGKIFSALDKIGLRYKIEELRMNYCPECNKIYTKDISRCEDCNLILLYERVGDITNERKSFVIERKYEQDLYSSIHNNKLYKQLDKLQKYYKGNTVLLFEGNLTKLAAENLDRAAQILSIPATCMQYGVSFIQSENEFTTAKMLKFFDYKSGKEPKYREELHTIHDEYPEMVKLLMTIKGIGKKTAFDIFLKYKNIYTLGVILKTAPEDVLKIKGIGESTLKLLIKWLT